MGSDPTLTFNQESTWATGRSSCASPCGTSATRCPNGRASLGLYIAVVACNFQLTTYSPSVVAIHALSAVCLHCAEQRRTGSAFRLPPPHQTSDNPWRVGVAHAHRIMLTSPCMKSFIRARCEEEAPEAAGEGQKLKNWERRAEVLTGLVRSESGLCNDGASPSRYRASRISGKCRARPCCSRGLHRGLNWAGGRRGGRGIRHHAGLGHSAELEGSGALRP
jgi:hypothetical protein